MTIKFPILKKTLVIDNVATGLKARHLRIKKNMTLADVAEKAGITLQHLSRLEQGQTPWKPEHLSAVKDTLLNK